MHRAWYCLEEVSYCFPRSSVKYQGQIRTVPPVWIHQWLWNDAQSLKQHRRGDIMFIKVIHQISRSHGKKCQIRNWAFPDRNSSLNSPTGALKWCTKLNVVYERCRIVFQGHPSNFKVTWDKNHQFWANWAFPDCNWSLTSPMDLKWCTKLDVV